MVISMFHSEFSQSCVNPNYLVYKLYRRRIPFECLGSDQATIND